MGIFVVYNDDRGDRHEPDSGIMEFTYDGKSLEKAIAFIEERMAKAEVPDIGNYTVIEGKELELEVVERISKIKIKGR